MRTKADARQRLSFYGFTPSLTRTASIAVAARGMGGAKRHPSFTKPAPIEGGHGPSRPYPSHCSVAAAKQPDGQIFAFAVGQITFRTPAILSPRKGRWPSSRTLGWDVVDAAASCARWDGRAGFTVRERSQDVLTSDAEAYGEVVWS
jgi:hypothetical protein